MLDNPNYLAMSEDKKPPRPFGKQIDAVRRVIEEQHSDVFVFNAPIRGGTRTSSTGDQFIDVVLHKEIRRPVVTLFLTTNGGDPDMAFRMIRILRKHYARVRIAVVGPCKSAGTLLAAGGHELVMGPNGELGPLDIQMSKADELMISGSGLDILMALNMVTSSAFDTFQDYLLQLTTRSGGSISTRTAADISAKLVTGLFAPIAAHIDPIRLAEAQRAINIVKEYVTCLGDSTNLKDGALDQLVTEYPSHSFVIDLERARIHFKSVSDLTEAEVEFSKILEPILRWTVSGKTAIFDAETFFPAEEEESDEDDQTPGGEPESASPHGGGAAGDKPEAQGSDSPEAAHQPATVDGRPVRKKKPDPVVGD